MLTKRLRAVLAAWAVIAACAPTAAPVSPSPSSGGAVTPAINEQTRGEIQALVQRQHDTMAARDQKSFDATVDPERRALVRCADENYDIAGRQGVPATGQVGKIEAYLDYVRAYVQTGSNGQRRLFFRRTANGAWVQSEPTEPELGGEQKTMVGDVQIEYWGVDQDAVAALGRASLAARQLVLANLLSDTRRDALVVRFYPTHTAAGIQLCLLAGYAFSTPTDPVIRILSYWFTSSGELSPYTVSLISHEWLHWAQDQFIPGIAKRLPWWLSEGWPDYAGRVTRYLPCRATWPTLKQLEDGADPSGPPEVEDQYYAFAHTMIEYLYATYGGKATYARLLLGFKDDAVPANTFPKVLNVTSVKFYDDWSAWAKKKYC